jgi:hypothetical protein
MAWTSPLTAVAGGVFSAAQFNQSVRDNLSVTSTGIATQVSSWFPASAANVLAERMPVQDNDQGSSTTTSTAYGNLADGLTTSVSVATGNRALVSIYANFNNSVNGNRTWMSFDVGGATTIAATDFLSVDHSFNGGMRWGATFLVTGLVIGTNSFTLRYRVTAGTGTFSVRRIAVIPL